MKSLPTGREAALRRRLLRWFSAARRDLPWRFPAGREDPYRTWVSEAMLQQTQVATVIPRYRRFLRRFPTLQALARAREEDVLAEWTGLGYYARARALSRAAREALARHGGLPSTVEALRGLPGFGPYTAGAVASIAFGVRAPAVDGNAGRVLARLFLVAEPVGTAGFGERVWRHAASLVSRARVPGDLNQALIELGALVCRRVPRCGDCPVESFCAARRAGRERAVPAPRRRPSRRVMHLAVGICVRNGEVLLTRRSPNGIFAGMWSPPFVEVVSGAEAAAAISKAIEREPSVETGEFISVGTLVRQLTHRELRMAVLAAPLTRIARKRDRLRLVPSSELGRLAVPTAMRAALELVERSPAVSATARQTARRGRRPGRPGSVSRGGGVGRRIERV